MPPPPWSLYVFIWCLRIRGGGKMQPDKCTAAVKTIKFYRQLYRVNYRKNTIHKVFITIEITLNKSCITFSGFTDINILFQITY